MGRLAEELRPAARPDPGVTVEDQRSPVGGEGRIPGARGAVRHLVGPAAACPHQPDLASLSEGDPLPIRGDRDVERRRRAKAAHEPDAVTWPKEVDRANAAP